MGLNYRSVTMFHGHQFKVATQKSVATCFVCLSVRIVQFLQNESTVRRTGRLMKREEIERRTGRF